MAGAGRADSPCCCGPERSADADPGHGPGPPPGRGRSPEGAAQAGPRTGGAAWSPGCNFTREVLAGALRSIVGRLTVEEVIRDRAAFA
ncbi:hypothetical protein ABZ436_31845, partial [Micromonospora matsumotoense]|uniref:hypothetical protein n=1 Tax=Micromonospora matsumotoense TaxID=121616 RepID=UPI00340D97A4